MAQVLNRQITGSSWSARRLAIDRRSHALAIVLVAAAGWSLFAWWYSLPANETNTHFAFEKIPEVLPPRFCGVPSSSFSYWVNLRRWLPPHLAPRTPYSG